LIAAPPGSGHGRVVVTFAGASDAVCLGRPATIIAMAGGVTRGTPGNDVIVARAGGGSHFLGRRSRPRL
jgi:hypothetical protein